MTPEAWIWGLVGMGMFLAIFITVVEYAGRRR